MPLTCMIEGVGWAAPQSAVATALQQRAVTMPLFLAAIAPSGMTSCTVARDDGEVSLRYAARDGSSLRLARDDSIEYNDQEARLAVPLREAPIAMLKRAEQAAFAAKGCGIDWTTPEFIAEKTPGGGTTALYRGDVCNCAARVHRTAGGLIDAVGLRSTC